MCYYYYYLFKLQMGILPNVLYYNILFKRNGNKLDLK
jgi:hypothetical protein